MERFRKIYEQTAYVRVEILLDTQTGVQYVKSDHGITPLLDSSGRPVTGSRNIY